MYCNFNYLTADCQLPDFFNNLRESGMSDKKGKHNLLKYVIYQNDKAQMQH
jgi:hypothetical protein